MAEGSITSILVTKVKAYNIRALLSDTQTSLQIPVIRQAQFKHEEKIACFGEFIA